MAHVRVAVRVRPLSQREKRDGAATVITGSHGSVTIQDLRVPEQAGCDHRPRYHQFRLDHCFFSGELDESTVDEQQMQVYAAVGLPLLEETLAGYNCCLLAYGQSGSGKTHTMLGRPEYPGMMSRLCEELLSRLPAEGKDASISLSCIEMYKETVRDLLGDPQKSLRIREHPQTGPYVEELGLRRVTSAASLRDLLSSSMARRQCGATQLNHSSSRSHALVTVHLRRRRSAGWVTSKLHLVDLAGSERAGAGSDRFSRTRLTEGASINRSLVALGNVISALAEQSRPRQLGGAERRRRRRGSFVSYRSSVLTWLLKDSLGGNAKTAMVATVSPASTSYSDTLSTLRYAERAKAIVNSPVLSDEPRARIVLELQAEVDRLKGLLALNKMANSGVPTGADIASTDRRIRRRRTGRALASGLHHSSYQRLSASEPDLPSPRLEEAPPPPTSRRRQPLTRGQATELPETPAAERPSPIGAEETVRRPGTTTASSSRLSLVSGDSELWDELRGIACERERRCWANFLLWEQRRGLYRPASVPGNMQRVCDERRSRRQVVREVVRRLYPGGGGGGGGGGGSGSGGGGHGHGHAPPEDAADPDWCCCGQRKRRREGSAESRPYEKRSRRSEDVDGRRRAEDADGGRKAEDADEAAGRAKSRRQRSGGESVGRSPAAGAQDDLAPNGSRLPHLRPTHAPDPTVAMSAPSRQRDRSQPASEPRGATLSCSVDEGLGGSFDVCAPPTFSDDSLEPSDLGLSQDSLDMIDADSVEELTVGKRRIDSLFRPALSEPVVAAPVLVRTMEYRKQPPGGTGSHRTGQPKVTGAHRKPPQEATGHRKSLPDTIIRISMTRPTVSSDSEWGSTASSPEMRQSRTGRAEIRRRAEERFSCSGASDSEDDQRFVSATDRARGDTLSLLTMDDASDSISFQSALGEPDRWSTCSEREPSSLGHPVIHFPSPPPPDVFVDQFESPGPPTSAPTGIVHPFRPSIDSGELNAENDLSDGSPTAACGLYTIAESAGESDVVAIDSRASPAARARPSAAPAMASQHSDVGATASVAAGAAGGRSVLERRWISDRRPLCDADWRRRRAREAAAAAPAAAGWIDADMWERYVSRLDVRSHLLLEEARRRPGLAVSLLVRSRSLPDLAEGPAGGHVSRLFRSALSVTVHGRPPPQPDQRLLYSLPPEVRERSVVQPCVESIPEDGDGASSEASASSASSSSLKGSSSSNGSDAGSEEGSGSGAGRELGDETAAREERVTAALDEEEPTSPPTLPGSTPGDLVGLPAPADQLCSLRDVPPVFSDSSGDGRNSVIPTGAPADADAIGAGAERAGEVVRSEATTERLTQRIETTETHRDARHTGPRILTYEIVEEVNVFVRGSGETRVSTSRSASVSRVPAVVEEGEAGQSEVSSSHDMSIVGRQDQALEQSSRTHKVWDYRTEVLHFSPKCRQLVTSTMDVETRVRDAPLAESEESEKLRPAECDSDGSELPSLKNWAPDEPPVTEQRQNPGLERQPSEQHPPSLEPWESDEAPHLNREPSNQPPSLEPSAPNQSTCLEQQPPSLEEVTPDQPSSLEQWGPDQPPSLEQWAPDQPPNLEQWAPDQSPSLEQHELDQPPSLEQWESDQPPSLEQWLSDQPPSLEQWSPGVDSSLVQRTNSPPRVYVAVPLNITEPPGVGSAGESLPCPRSVTTSGRDADGFHFDQPTAAELSPVVPFSDTHGRVPPSPFRLITNVEDEEVQISSRREGIVSPVQLTSPTVVTADHMTMTSQEPAALSAPLSTAVAACDPQTPPGSHRPDPDRKAAAVVRPADESRARPTADAPGIDAGSFVDRRTSPESISGGAATEKSPQVISPDMSSGVPGVAEPSARDHSLSPDKIERWSCDPPPIFIFEVEEQGALLRRDETRFIDADADAAQTSVTAVETQPQVNADRPRSPRTPVEEQFFFFKTTEEEPSLETIEEEIVEAFDESSSSLSSSSSSSCSKNTSRDVDNESLRSDVTGASGVYEVNPPATASPPDAGSPRQALHQENDSEKLTTTVHSAEKQSVDVEGIDQSTLRMIESRDIADNGVKDDEIKDEPPQNESLNLIQLSSEKSPREVSDPVCSVREAADTSEPASGRGGASSGTGASVSSNVQADRELEEVSGRLEVMSSSALLSKVDSEGGESGAMTEPRSGSPRLPETPERPDAAAQEESVGEAPEVQGDVQEAEQEGETAIPGGNDASDLADAEKEEKSALADDVPAPREAWVETPSAVPELLHAVSVEECEEFNVFEEELMPLPPTTAVVETPLEMMTADECWEDLTAGELSEIQKLPWRNNANNGMTKNASKNDNETPNNTCTEKCDPSAELRDTFVDSSIEPDMSLPPFIHPGSHHEPPETSVSVPSAGASELVSSANRPPAFEEGRVTSVGIDPRGAPPAEPPIDTDAAASDPGWLQVGRATESAEGEMHGPAVEDRLETVLCYPDDRLEAPDMKLEQLETDGENIDCGDGKMVTDAPVDPQVAAESVESSEQYSEVLTVRDSILCYPDTMDVPLLEIEQLQDGDKPVASHHEHHENHQPGGETNEIAAKAAKVVEEALHGPAKEEMLIDVLCYGDDTTQAPTFECEQCDVIDKGEGDDDTYETNLAELGKTQQASEALEHESQGSAVVENIFTVLCLADSTAIDYPSEQNDESLRFDTEPVINDIERQQAAESVIADERNLQAEEGKATILCYADDTKTATTLNLESFEDANQPGEDISNDIEDKHPGSVEGEQYYSSENIVSGVHSPAVEVPLFNVLCFADSEMVAPEIEIEMLGSVDDCRELVTGDRNSPEVDQDNQNAFKLAETIVSQVMSKASTVLQGSTANNAEQNVQCETVLEGQQGSSERAPQETVIVTQCSEQSEEDETGEASPRETIHVSCHTDDVANKASLDGGEDDPCKDPKAGALSEDVLSQVVSNASEVHIVQDPVNLQYKNKRSATPNAVHLSDSPTSEETEEPIAVKQSSYVCGSEQSTSEDETGTTKNKGSSSSHRTPLNAQAQGEKLVEVTPADIDVDECSKTSGTSRNVGDAETEPEVQAAEVVSVITKASENVVSQVVDSAIEVHAYDTPARFQSDETDQVTPGSASSSHSTTPDDAKEPAAVRRSTYQCGSEEIGDADGAWATCSEHDLGATSPQMGPVPHPDKEGIEATKEDSVQCTPLPSDMSRRMDTPEVQSYNINVEEVQVNPTKSTDNSNVNNPISDAAIFQDFKDTQSSPKFDSDAQAAISTACTKNEAEKGKQDDEDTETIMVETISQVAESDEPLQDAASEKVTFEDVLGHAETGVSKISSGVVIPDNIESDSRSVIAQCIAEIPEKVPMAPDAEADTKTDTMNDSPCGSKHNDTNDETHIDLNQSRGLKGSHMIEESAFEINRIEVFGDESPLDSVMATQHTKVTEVKTSPVQDSPPGDAETLPDDTDGRTPGPIVHDLLDLQISSDSKAVKGCTSTNAAEWEKAQETSQHSAHTTEEVLCFPGKVQIDRQDASETPVISAEDVTHGGISPDELVQVADGGTTDEFQRHLLEEVDEQTPSLDTVESVEMKSKDDPGEIFYSFDTEDETMLDAMKIPHAIRKDAGSSCESVDFTEVTITVRGNSPPTYPGGERDSEDSSSETPVVSMVGPNWACRSVDPDVNKLQETTFGKNQPETMKSLQITTEISVKAAQSETFSVQGETTHLVRVEEPQGQWKTEDDSKFSEKGSCSAEPRVIQEKSGTNSLTKQPSRSGNVVSKEEVPLTSFSDVSQVKPLVLNRAKSLSMSDESEADDWDPPSPAARRQPLLKLDIRPRTSLGELDGALSPREAVPQPPVSRPLRTLTPTLTDITETEGDLLEEPLQAAVTLYQLARYSHNFGDDDEEKVSEEEKKYPRSQTPTPPVSPTVDRKVQMWQQYVELQHATDEPSSPPQALSTSDIMYLYIESGTGAGSASELSDVGLSAAVPRHEHHASAVRLERTVSAECVRRRRRDGLSRSNSADGLLQRGRAPVDIANIIALGRLPLASPELRDDTEATERGREKKCVSWNDLHGSGELEMVHGSPDGELPQPLATRSDSEESSSETESEEEADVMVEGSRHQRPLADFDLTMPDEVRRRALQYLPAPHSQHSQLEIANWDLIGQDVGIPLVKEQYTKRLANASTQTLCDASSQTDYTEDTAPSQEQLRDVQSGHYHQQQPTSESYGYPYSSFTNYDPYPASRPYDARNSFNNPNLRSDPHVYNIHTSSNYDSFSRSQYAPHISSDAQRYSFEYTPHHVYVNQSTTPPNTSGSRADSLERQICRELASLRQERERSRSHWDGDMERRRRMLQVENSLQKSLQQMRTLVTRRRARARVIMETLPPFQASYRQSRMTTALPAYRQNHTAPSVGLDTRLADVAHSYDMVDCEYDSSGLDYPGRLREAPSVTHILHQEIHVPPCCSHAPAPARPAAAGGSPRRMTPSQYRQHLAAIRRKILAQPPTSAAQPSAMPSDASAGRLRVDPWGPAEPTRRGSAPLTRSEPDLSRAGGAWRSNASPTVAGSTGDLGPRLYDTGFVSTGASRARYGLF